MSISDSFVVLRGRGRVMAAVAMAVVLVAGAVFAGSVVAAPAHNGGQDGLAEVGPVDHSPNFGGFPTWYKDTNGLRLELCLDEADALCIPGFRQDPGQPIHFPDNFSDEAFWWAGDALMETANGGGALLVLALEAAFVNGPPAVDEQVAFSRIRIRADNLPAGAYEITHPYGVDQFDVDAGAANAPNSINVSEDTGDFSGGCCFESALTGRTGPFLIWDSDLATLPAGYLADPGTPHTVTGSPFSTNFFQIVGPPGAFTGSADVCPWVTDGSCIRTDLFNVQAKESLRAGVEATRVGYSTVGGTGFVDVFAKSDVGQIIRVTGAGLLESEMIGDGTGGYFVRIAHGATVPTNLVLTNITDQQNSVANVLTVVDDVHVNSALYDMDASTLTVTAQSQDDSAALLLNWTGTVITTGSPGTVYTFVVENLSVPPAVAGVISDAGGADSDDVVVVGSGVDPIALVAAPVAVPAGPLQPGQTFSLDGSGSEGTIDTYVWEQTGGTPIAPFDSANPTTGPAASLTGLVAPDLGASGGQLTFQLTVQRDTTMSPPVSVAVDVAGSGQPPVADAGSDQLTVLPNSTVTLNGSASQNASTFSWVQVDVEVGTAAVVLNGANTPNPTFTAPIDEVTRVFELTVTNGSGPDTALVRVQADLDDAAVDSAQFRSEKSEWRIQGTTQYCEGGNQVAVELMRRDNLGVAISVGVIGTDTPSLAAPDCTWQVRVRGSDVEAQGGDWLRATTTLGGFLDNETFVSR